MKDSAERERLLEEIEILRKRVAELEAAAALGGVPPAERTEEKLRAREAAIQRSLAELEAIYDSARIGLCVLDRDLRFLRVNERLAEIDGVPAADHIGRTVGEVIPEISAKVESSLRLVLETGQPVLNFELSSPRRRQPGERTWLEHYVPIKNPAGAVVGINVVVEEVTEIRLAMEALKASEEKQRRLFERMIQGVVYHDKDGGVTSANPAWLKMFGLTEEQVKNRLLHELGLRLIHEDGRPFEVEEFPAHRALLTGLRVRGVMLGIPNPSDDSCRWAIVNCTPRCESGSNKPSGAFCVFTDVTDLKKAQTELLQTKVDLDAAFEAMTEGVIFHNPDGSLRYANPAAKKLLGVEDDAFFSATFGKQAIALQLRRPDGGSIAEHEMPFNRAAKGEVVVREEYVFTPVAGGSDRCMLVSAGPVRGENGAVALLTDITEIRRLERDRDNAREIAEKASRAKSEFLANMSHELRTPISGIIGMAEILEKRLADRNELNYVTNIEAAARTLHELVGEILDFSKIDAEGVRIVAENFDLGGEIRKVVAVFAESARANGTALSWHIDPRVPLGLRGDRRRLGRILRNLTSNAVKFSRNGQVAINVSPGNREDGTIEILFKVSDSGPGIPEDRLEHIFQAFYQGGSHLTKQHEGAGLGLAITKKLVEALQGSIRVESREGLGTTFFVSLPFEIPSEQDPAVSKAPAKSDLLGRIRPLRVLVAEDNRINQLFILEILQSHGHSVAIAPNGVIASNLAEKADFDLILMDIQMPEMDGLEAMRRIRSLPPPKNDVPIIALTAYAMPEDEDQARRAGANGYISKPVDWESLVSAICDLGFERTQPASDSVSINEPPLVNPESLKHYAGPRRRMLESLVVSFDESLKEHLPIIQSGFSEGRPEKSAQAAHAIAGGAAIIGLERLRSEALSIERQVKKGEVAYAEETAGRLAELVAESLARLREILDESPAPDVKI